MCLIWAEKPGTAYFLRLKQECIPVGCIPAARRPYAGVCFPGGLSAWSRGLGGSASSGGASACSGGGGASQHALRQTPPLRGQNS